MRRAGYNSSFIFDNNVLVGVILEADFTAEHEFGINNLKEAFGITENPRRFGIKNRVAHQVPKHVYYQENNEYAVLMVLKSWHRDANCCFKLYDNELYLDNGFAGAWDGSSFGIKVTKENIPYLKEIYHAILDKNIIIMIGGKSQNLYRGGLFIGILDKIPETAKIDLYNSDRDWYNLTCDAKKTGIYQKLEKAGKKYYALSPAYTNKNNTKYKVHFFLNPREQHLYNFGWFTVEELEDWAQNKGPVCKDIKELNNYV